MGNSGSRPGGGRSNGERPQQEAGVGGTDGEENPLDNNGRTSAAGRGFAPQQVVSVHLTGGEFPPTGPAGSGGLFPNLDLSGTVADAAAAAATHDILMLQQQRQERLLPGFSRSLRFPSLCPAMPDPLPRLNVQQTCVIKNPVNLLKPTLRCFQEPASAVPGKEARLLLSFSLDATTAVEVSVHFFARQVVDASTGDIAFVSAFASPPSRVSSPRRLPAGMKQLFEMTYAEGLSVSAWEQQQSLLDEMQQDPRQQQEDVMVYPVVVSLRSIREAAPAEAAGTAAGGSSGNTGSSNSSSNSSNAGAAAGGGGAATAPQNGTAAADKEAIKNQYTFARILRIPATAAPPAEPAQEEASGDSSTTAGSSSALAAGPVSSSSSSSAAPAQGKEGGGEEAAAAASAAQWRIQVVKQKVQFGLRVFEVQEIFGIERGAAASAAAKAAPAASATAAVGSCSSSQTAAPAATEAPAAAAASGEEASQPPPQNDSSGSDRRNSAEGDLLSGRECVICLAEERSTAVLPCRHMCLCTACANIMRMQSNRCPICRHRRHRV